MTGKGIERLLELVLLEAELLELRANPNKRASGTIIEAKLDKGRGPVATVLVQKGTLRKGDPFITGVFYGRVRALQDENGKNIEEATPSIPVQVLGLTGVPQAGDRFEVTVEERDAREVSQKRQQLKREQDYRNVHNVSLSDLHYQIQQGQIKELKVIVKGDVDGSVEAITQELGGIAHDEVRVAVIHSGVGVISETDVLLASASNAIIIGFRVNMETTAREMALKNHVEIRHYKVIYEVIEEIRAALSGLLAPLLESMWWELLKCGRSSLPLASAPLLAVLFKTVEFPATIACVLCAVAKWSSQAIWLRSDASRTMCGRCRKGMSAVSELKASAISSKRM